MIIEKKADVNRIPNVKQHLLYTFSIKNEEKKPKPADF